MRYLGRWLAIVLILLLGSMLQSCGGDQDADKEKQVSQESSQVQRPGNEQAKESDTGTTAAGEGKASSTQAIPQTETGPQPVGRLVLLRGDVKVKRKDSQQALTPRVGFKIFLNDRIITSKNGYARMRLRDDSILRIAPTSELAVTTQLLGPEHNNTTIDLLKGKLRAIVVHKLSAGDSFEVKTNIAVAGVRGTDFEVIAGSGRDTVVRCFKGVVAITNLDKKVSGDVLLTPRTYTQVAEQAPPLQPMRLPTRVVPMEDPLPGALPTETDELYQTTAPTANTPFESAPDVTPPVNQPRPDIEMPSGMLPADDSHPQASMETEQEPREANMPLEPATEPQAAPEPEPPISQARSQQLMEESFDESRKRLKSSDVNELWEQKQEQPLQDLLYGDGLNGWTVHPAR